MILQAAADATDTASVVSSVSTHGKQGKYLKGGWKHESENFSSYSDIWLRINSLLLFPSFVWNVNDKNMLYFCCVTQCFSLSLITHKLKLIIT